MKREWLHRASIGVLFLVVLLTAPAAGAQYWVSFEDHTRYMALGDSLSAGYAAHPATQGFVYQLYQGGVIDNVNHTLFCNASVPNATSADVLAYQVPQVGLFFFNTGTPYRKVITLTVGGNDLLQILGGADPATVLRRSAAISAKSWGASSLHSRMPASMSPTSTIRGWACRMRRC
jgi:lysophospholipase L1-like esterase